MADLIQEINRVYSSSRCLNETFPWIPKSTASLFENNFAHCENSTIFILVLCSIPALLLDRSSSLSVSIIYFIFTEKFSASIERLSCSWTNRELQTEVYDRRILYSYTIILLQTYRFCPHWPLLWNAEIPPTISKFNGGHLLLRFLMIQLNITSSKEMICRHCQGIM